MLKQKETWHTRAPIAAGMPTVRAIAVVVLAFFVLPNSKRVARWFSFGWPSGNSTSTSWCKRTISCEMEHDQLSIVIKSREQDQPKLWPIYLLSQKLMIVSRWMPCRCDLWPRIIINGTKPMLGFKQQNSFQTRNRSAIDSQFCIIIW